MTNNCKTFFAALLMLMLLCMIGVQAQNLDNQLVTGTVMTEKGEFLQGVTVELKEPGGKSISRTVTSEKGTFQFTGLKAGDRYDFFFSYIGYEAQTIKAFTIKPGNGNSMLVRMKEESQKLNDVVVIGYGTQNKKDVTTAISSLKASDINNFPATGLDKALTGKLAGVQVLQPAGGPGAGISIVVRGKGTITAGSDPLYVIDGVPLSDNDVNGPGFKVNPLNAINVNDIETIDILKDASAAAIYGSRGSNGVVLITTKRGKKDKPEISWNSYYGNQQVSKKMDMLNAYQYAQLIYEAHNNTYFDLLAARGLTGSAGDDNATRATKLSNPTTNLTYAYLLPPEINPYLNNQPGLTNTDWQDQIFQNAPMQSHSLSIGGGNENIKYYISGNYLDQSGVILNSGYLKYNGRANIDANYKKLKLGVSINYTSASYNYQTTEGRFNGGLENIASTALVSSPFYAPYNSDGSFNYDQTKWLYSQSQPINPVALALLKSDKTIENKIIANAFSEYQISKDLKYKLSLGINSTTSNRNTFRPSSLPNSTTFASVSNPTGNYYSLLFTNWVLENTVSYNKTFDKHTVRAIIGFSSQKEKDFASNITGTGYANDIVKTLNAATNITSWSSTINEWSLMSALARVQYDYSGKYLLSAALRADGSSRFGPTNRWGYFPSASVGWNILRESFMKDPKIISNLKLRGSYGVTGNFQIGNYASQSIISSSNYVFGPQGGTALASGLYQSTAGNPKLGWEKTSAINLGFEIGVLKDQYNLIVDVYNNNTKDLLLNVPVPQSTGFSTNLVNIGKVNNKGFELTFNTNNQIGKFHLTTNTNFSQNWNKVIDLGGANSIITQAQGVIYFITQVGKPIGNYYTLVQTGIFKDQTDVDTTAVKAPGVKPGDMKFKDVNGDGKIDVTNDRAITGNYMPKFTYGFSAQLTYKIIDLSVAFQGIYGSTIANINQRHMNIPESFSNGTADLLNRWQSPSNPGNGIVPRANRSQTGYNATISTYHLAEGSYVRVRDITIGVTIPQSICKKAGIVNARFYASAQNPFTITKYKGYNPEVSIDPNPLTPGIDYGTYPLTKTIFFGLNLNF